jgi:hypothetical protein
MRKRMAPARSMLACRALGGSQRGCRPNGARGPVLELPSTGFHVSPSRSIAAPADLDLGQLRSPLASALQHRAKSGLLAANAPDARALQFERVSSTRGHTPGILHLWPYDAPRTPTTHRVVAYRNKAASFRRAAPGPCPVGGRSQSPQTTRGDPVTVRSTRLSRMLAPAVVSPVVGAVFVR